jgi:hypothetical protein
VKATPNPTNFADMFPFYATDPVPQVLDLHITHEVTLTLVLMDTYITRTIWIGH